jgi:hypothetical protein
VHLSPIGHAVCSLPGDRVSELGTEAPI